MRNNRLFKLITPISSVKPSFHSNISITDNISLSILASKIQIKRLRYRLQYNQAMSIGTI
jgi:hypothetical protein